MALGSLLKVTLSLADSDGLAAWPMTPGQFMEFGWGVAATKA